MLQKVKSQCLLFYAGGSLFSPKQSFFPETQLTEKPTQSCLDDLNIKKSQCCLLFVKVLVDKECSQGRTNIISLPFEVLFPGS